VGKTKKQKILEASMKIFFRDGFHKAKVSAIAEEAGIGKGTVYEYFNSKKQLFEEMIKYYINMYCEELIRSVQKEKDPIAQLKCYISYESKHANQHGNFAYLFERRGQALDLEVRKIMIAARNKVIRLIENIIATGIKEGVFKKTDPYIAALIFLGSVGQIVFNQIINKDNMQKRLEEEKLLEILLNGIKKE
jgi:AcrR family transcriptional regulator